MSSLGRIWLSFDSIGISLLSSCFIDCSRDYFTLNGLNGRVSSNPNYTWGALLCLIGIESVVDVTDDGVGIKGKGYNEPITIQNIVLGGKPRTVKISYKDPDFEISE